jgi:hypothetical protein
MRFWIVQGLSRALHLVVSNVTTWGFGCSIADEVIADVQDREPAGQLQTVERGECIGLRQDLLVTDTPIILLKPPPSIRSIEILSLAEISTH